MATPMFPRTFRFALPLFRNQGGPQSPWNNEISALKPPEVNDRQVRATFDVLCRFSKSQLDKNFERRAELIAAGMQGTTEFEQLKEKIAQQEEFFEDHRGGAAQFPFVNSDDYSFPIYEVRRDGDQLVAGNLPLRPYEIESFEPPWFPRQGNRQEGFSALDVPLPNGEFRPGGPASIDSDGNIILFDQTTGTEYDFWQVTTQVDQDQKSRGGGLVGETIVSTGSVSKFDTAGIGARFPEVDPSGSSRASGLPYLGGVLLPEDLSEGADSKIKHALAFAIPQLRYFPQPREQDPPNWVYPATRTEFFNAIADGSVLAAGQRITLADVLHGRDGFADTTTDVIKDETIPPIVRIFLDAIYNYGVFLVDGAGGFAFVAEDIHTANPQWTPAQVKELTGLNELDESKTPWQIVIDTLNEYLCCKLLNNSGLAFAYLDRRGFRSNFAVVEDLVPFYRAQC